MSRASRALRQIAKHVAGAPAQTVTRGPTPTIHSRGVIYEVGKPTSTNRVTTIRLAGSSVAVPCEVLDSYLPVVGHDVEVLVLPGRLLVLGTSSPFSS